VDQVLAEILQNDDVMGPFPRRNILSSRVVQLKCPEIAHDALPGQFVMVQCGEETVLRRPLSIHQAEGDRLALLYAVIGTGTQWLTSRRPGEKIDLLGPLGNGFTVHPDSRNLLLIAGGMGIAPLYYLAEYAVRQGRVVNLLYGTANNDRYHVPSGVTEVAATEDGSVGYQGMITMLIPQYLDNTDQVFACGPLPMYRDMATMPELKNKPVQVSLEMRMGCGFGVCYSCTIRTTNGLKQVCKDGPVFELNEINWEEIKI
jgi:dihydroorotate dehydrogenase electron transfer subunit